MRSPNDPPAEATLPGRPGANGVEQGVVLGRRFVERTELTVELFDEGVAIDVEVDRSHRAGRRLPCTTRVTHWRHSMAADTPRMRSAEPVDGRLDPAHSRASNNPVTLNPTWQAMAMPNRPVASAQ